MEIKVQQRKLTFPIERFPVNNTYTCPEFPAFRVEKHTRRVRARSQNNNQMESGIQNGPPSRTTAQKVPVSNPLRVHNNARGSEPWYEAPQWIRTVSHGPFPPLKLIDCPKIYYKDLFSSEPKIRNELKRADDNKSMKPFLRSVAI